jgi:hypothetical protein
MERPFLPKDFAAGGSGVGGAHGEGVDARRGRRQDGSRQAHDLRDLSDYRAVVHVGDLQGCRTVLDRPGFPLANGLRDDVFYVFAGDLVDRGIENGDVLRWWLDHAAGRSNVTLLWGNHEDHLHRWSRGMAPVSQEFAARTLPQLEAAGIRPEEAWTARRAD